MAKWHLRLQIVCADLVPLILSVSILSRLSLHEQKLKMQQIGLQARFMSQALRKMSGNASKAGCTLIFLNQIRYKIGVYYGNREVTSGGIALKFFASVGLEIRSTGKIKSVKGDEEIGVRVRVRVQKSKNIDKIHLVNRPVLVIHATVGPCNTPESNAWNAVEKSKGSRISFKLCVLMANKMGDMLPLVQA